MTIKSRTAGVLATGVACLALAAGGPTVAAHSASLPTWLHAGATNVYPSAGGTWQYGFWNAEVRSYYWVGKCHGTTVVYNGTTRRSIDTAPDAMSDAALWAYDSSGAHDTYYYRVC